jgi:hypothetical protein
VSESASDADAWQSCSEADQAALVEAHGKHWEPFAFQCAWQAPVEDEPRSRVYRAHFRNIYECVYLLDLPYDSSCIRPLQKILFTNESGSISTLARVRVNGNLCFIEAQSPCTFMRVISMASSPTTVNTLRLPHKRERKGKSKEALKELPWKGMISGPHSRCTLATAPLCSPFGCIHFYS